MRLIEYPEKASWTVLAKRPEENYPEVDRVVNEVFDDVELNGDSSLHDYSKRFDKMVLDSLSYKLTEHEKPDISPDLAIAIDMAYDNIWRFHTAQKRKENAVSITDGVECWRRDAAIQKVGLYIPGGTAPLFSSILMLAIPARIAGCKEIVLCTPPGRDQLVHPSIAYTCSKLGIDKIYLIGGAQAIAAMSIGTETVPKVDKIFGPGNRYVTKAKLKAIEYKVAIDMPAGPSELLVIADKNSNATWIAADLLSQAEHGKDSQVVLLADDKTIIEDVRKELDKQIEVLPRKEFAQYALSNSFAVLLDTIDDCIEFSNVYAPEHLIIIPDLSGEQLDSISNAGSVFLGAYSSESAGDYISGTNHTLPTNGYARMYSGVSYESFIKRITFQHISREGIKKLGPHIELMAEAEGLQAHKNAISIRLKGLGNG